MPNNVRKYTLNAIGKKADIQLVNIRKLGLCPITDPVSTLIYHAHAADVDTVMVNGKILVADGKVLSMNETDLVDNAQRVSDDLWQRFHHAYPSTEKQYA